MPGLAAMLITVVLPLPALAVGRVDEPVVLRLTAVPELIGEAVAATAVFRYDSGSDSYQPIPYQIDERLLRDFPGVDEQFKGFTEEIYDVFREDDGILDQLDEIAFMFGDAGGQQAPASTPWPAAASGRRYELRIADPRPSNPEPDRYVYVFTGSGLPQSAVSYVSWTGRGIDPITTDFYTLEYTGKWLWAGYRVTGCGSGADLLDRLKGRAGNDVDNGESEELWDITATYLGAGPPSNRQGIHGPIRAIRYVRGAGSGKNTTHHDIVYRRQWFRNVKLRVHPLNTIWLYLDWLPIPGLTLYTPTQRGGLPQDGNPDVPLYTGLQDWDLLRSPQGGMVWLYDIPPSPLYQQLDSYLRDDAAFDDYSGQPATYTDDDDSAYGNHGFRMSGIVGQESDVVEMRMKFWGLCADEGDANLADEYQALEDFPLAVTPTVERQSSLVVDLSLTKSVNNPNPVVGDNVVFTTTVANAAGFDDATAVRVLDLVPTGYSYVADDGGGAFDPGSGVWEVGSVAAGAMRTLNVTVTVRGTGVWANEAQVVTADQSDVDDTYADGQGEDWDSANVLPQPRIDLSLAKVVDNPAPPVGVTVLFSITVSNDPDFSDASGVAVSDLLPSGYTYVADDSSTSGTVYSPASGLWSVGQLPAGGSETLNITAAVNPTGDYTNVAEVLFANETDVDSVPGNGVPSEDDYDTATTTPGGMPVEADLSLTMTVDNPTPAVQADVVFTLTVSNSGPDDASGVQVRDLLPTGYVYVSDDGGGSYVPGTGIWSVGAVVNAGSATLDITATVQGSGNYTNAAEVTAAGEADPDSTPNNGVTTEDDYAQATTTPTARIDLSLSKSVNDSTPAVGSDVVFAITVSNGFGFSTATGVAVTDLLPSGYAYVSDDGGGSYDPVSGLWSVGTLAAADSLSLHVTATVNGSGGYTNVAEVTAADQPDLDSTPNNGVTTEDDYASADTQPQAPLEADLSLGKTVDNPTPDVGSNVVFTLTVSNAGPDGATGVAVTDLLPGGYAYVGDDGGGSYVPATGVWTVGAVAAAGSATLNITATVNASGVYLNSGEVTAANESDPDSTPNNGVTTEDDYAEASTTPVPVADLSLGKTVDNPTPTVGSDVVFTLTVSNAGPSDGTGVEVTDLLPSGYTYVSDDGGGSYVPATGVWTVGSVANAAGATLNVIATVEATGVYLNSAEVTAANESDPDSTPNNGVTTEDDYAEASTAPVPPPEADLSLGKTVDNPTPNVGSDVVFTLTVSNAGPDGATGVEVTDLLPGGYAYVGDDGGGSYVPATGVWTVGVVAAAGSATLNITATVQGAGGYLNTAEITAAGESDPDSTPNNGVTTEDDYAEASTTPSPRIDLSLTKTVDNPTPPVGSDVVFSVTVTNAPGFTDATGVVVTDKLPSGYTYVSDDAASSGTSYNPNNGRWTVGSLTASSGVTLNVTATVRPSGNYLNAAEVTAANEIDADSTPNNGVTTEDDYAEASTTPSQATEADLSLGKTVDNPTPNVGSDVVFTLTVSNAGPSDATGVEVTDLLPGGYTYVSDDGGGSYVPGTGVWTVGGVANAGGATLNITATVNASGVYLNSAEVTAANESDPDSTPNNGVTTEDDYAEASTTPVPQPEVDLSLGKTVDNSVPPVGSDVVFTVDVSNAAGFADATGVQVGDLLPTGYRYVSSTTTSGTYTAGTGIWTVGAVAAGGSGQLTITATVLGAGDYLNEAEVTAADQPDANDVYGDGMGGDYGSASTAPTAVVDLSVRKSVDNLGPGFNENVTFTVTVSNDADFSGATGVVVRDKLPNGYQYVSDDSAGSGTTYNPSNGDWAVGALPAGASATLNIVAKVRTSGNYTNVAEVTAADQPDTDSVPGNGDPAEDDRDTATTTPGSIRTLQARLEGGDLVLSWQAVTGATAYRVYSSDSPDLPKNNWTFLGEVSTTEFRDTNVAAQPDRYYSVTAYSPSAGEGPH